jgi:magnesium-transporting ATPase (P-type)
MKVSNVMKLMNKLLYSVFLFQFILCLFFSFSFIIWQNSKKDFLPYLIKYDKEFELIKPTASFGDLIAKFFTFYVAYSHLIPISLYVAMELVKLIQGMLINFDTGMIDPFTKIPAISRTSDLIEELGQVRFIFSDKTGTLTKNEMEFKKCFINNVIYGNELSNDQKEFALDQEVENGILENYNICGDKRAYFILKNKNMSQKMDRKLINDFFTIMAVCHSAYLDIKKDTILFQVKYIKKLVLQP